MKSALSVICEKQFTLKKLHEKQLEISEPDSILKEYYNGVETRLGYKLLLGGTMHHGWYDKDTKWPFPFKRSLRLAEDRLASNLNLHPGAKVLDAGCGNGQVAMTMARWGLQVEGVDILGRHVLKARANIGAAGLEEQINVRQCSFQTLYPFASDTFDGVYAMEALPHALNLDKVVSELYRVLKPGGHLVLNDFDLGNSVNATSAELTYNHFILSKLAGPSIYPAGVWQTMLAEAGFEDVVVKDITRNVYPMVRALAFLGYGPYVVNKLLGLEKHFPNAVAAVKTYQHIRRGVGWRFLSIQARKPLPSSSSSSEKMKSTAKNSPPPASVGSGASESITVPECWISCGENGEKEVVEVEHTYGEEWEEVVGRDGQGKEMRVKIGVCEVPAKTPQLGAAAASSKV